MSKYPLTLLAWLNVVLHVAGLVFAATAMSPGTPLAPLPQRMQYLATAPLGWTLGWVCWMLCALLLITFLAYLTRRLHEHSDLARLGLVIALIGAAFDLFCDSIYVCVFPMLAAWQPPSEQLFLAVEKITGLGSLIVANGLYSVAILLVSTAMRERAAISRLGYAVGIAGLTLAAAGFTGSAQHAKWATVPTMTLFCIWVVLVARSLEANAIAGK